MLGLAQYTEIVFVANILAPKFVISCVVSHIFSPKFDDALQMPHKLPKNFHVFQNCAVRGGGITTPWGKPAHTLGE